jgi:predicted metal-dependent hydrolase
VKRFTCGLCILVFLPILARAGDRVQLQLNTSEADAVLTIIAKHQAAQTVTDADWQELFSTEPYIRLKKRETGLHRDFTDEQFKQFVLSSETAKRAPDLQRTLQEWKKADLNAAARRVLAYLPGASVIRAKVFPVIKWQTNSFVTEPTTDPTIFLYLDPKQGRAGFEIIVAHELHHIGLASNDKAYEQAIASLPPGPRQAAEWMGAFGEGLAMLAAAGGPGVNPVATYRSELQAEWKHDMGNFNPDLGKVQEFFTAIAEGRMSDPAEIRQRGMDFFGSIGPWYSVGYRMAVLVEKRYGRAALISCMLDFRKLLASYNVAAAEQNARGGEPLALWSPELLAKIGGQPVR